MTVLGEWELFLQGFSEEALRVFREDYQTNSDRGALRNAGLALLDLRRFGEAIDVFTELRNTELAQKATSEMTLVDLGISRWCTGDQAGALNDWEASLDTDYADEAGGVQ